MGQPAARSLLSQHAVLRQSFRRVNDLVERYLQDQPPGLENLASTLARLFLDLQETVDAKMNRQERLLYPALIQLEEAGGAGTPDLKLPAAHLGTLIALAVKESEVALMAARALGMSRLKAIRYIILPQAIRLAIPPWSNEAAIVLKDSSLVYVIGVVEILRRAEYVSARTLQPFLAFGAAALIYFTLTFLTNRGLDWLERRYKLLM